MTAPLRKLVDDLCAHAPPALVQEALSLALAQAGDYQGPEPARMLARLIEDAFAGSRLAVVYVEQVTRAVEGVPPEIAKPDEDGCDEEGVFTDPNTHHRFTQLCARAAGHDGNHWNGLRGGESLSWPKETP